MNQQLHQAVPTQRPRCLLNSNETHSINAKSWTAARCCRLLRPLTSRVELLKKVPARITSAGVHTDAHHGHKTSIISDLTNKERARVSKDSDVCWKPVSRRVQRTYSSRCKLRGDLDDGSTRGTLQGSEEMNKGRKRYLLPGEILVPTPILSRSKDLVLDPAQEVLPNPFLTEVLKSKTKKRPRSRYTTKDGEAHFELAETMRRISSTTNVTHYKIYEGIYNALEALLRATVSHKETAVFSRAEITLESSGESSSVLDSLSSRTLLSMCLKSVPRHIKMEESRAAAEGEETGLRSAFDTWDISAETYSELESYGTSRRGWKYLQTVVRAHGILVINDAIQQGFINAPFASALVWLCVHSSANSEAESLLSALLTSFQYPDPKSADGRFCDDPLCLPLSTLEKFVTYTGRVDYYYRQVQELILGGNLSVTWLGTKSFSSLWTSVFRSFSSNPSSQHATKFMSTILPLICNGPLSLLGKEDAFSSIQAVTASMLDATFTSVMTTLSAIGILSSRHIKNFSHIVRDIFLGCQHRAPDVGSNHIALVAAANVLLCLNIGGDAEFARDITESLGGRSPRFTSGVRSRSCVPAFVYSVARCCGRGSSGDGFDHLNFMLERLRLFASITDFERELALREIIVDSAFEFAQHHPSPEYLQYACQMGKTLRGSYIEPMTSVGICGPVPQDGLRWEEGISEWVTATPAANSRKWQKARLIPQDDESDFETPVKPRPKRHRNWRAPHPRPRVNNYQFSLPGRLSDLAPLSPKESSEDVRIPLGNLKTLSDQSPPHIRPERYHRASRKYVNKFGRLESAHLCSRQEWRLAGDNEDELSLFVPLNSGVSPDVYLEFPGSLKCGLRQQLPISVSTGQTRTSRNLSIQEHSEDELSL